MSVRKMRLKLNSQRCFLFVIGSWLMAKLWWTFEMSRLAFYRSLPTKRINQVMYSANLPAMSHWSYEHDRFSILNYDDKNNTFVLYKLPKLHRN